MASTLGESVVLGDLALDGRTYAGELTGAAAPSIAGLVDAAARDAVGGPAVTYRVDATVRLVPHARPRLVEATGTVRGTLPLLCQRCLELVAMPVDGEFALALCDTGLDAEALAPVADRLERWDHDAPTLVPASLIEEWILLELPMVIVHPRLEDCGALARSVEGPATGTQTPFAGLQDLLQGRSGDR